ncbi:hypothetical protein ABVK25_005171 [Lepraria finkii]|uniref:mannan endo-1,6-alpha-mannosidase n=1 Tax=Lepraria finkii TaxID=1340010 RepID=A0ABR4BAH9_9LECA
MHFSTQGTLFCAAIAATVAQAIQLNVTDTDSIRTAASTIAYNMMTYYTGNFTGNEPDLLPQPYYWWEAGAMWGGMVEYWHYTGDTSYNSVVAQAILAQKSPTNDFLMPEQVYDTGNDDQAFWGLTAITAAERKFPPPSPPIFTHLHPTGRKCLQRYGQPALEYIHLWRRIAMAIHSRE